MYRGGVVSYWTEVKAAVLGVPQPLLDQYGAVSESAPGPWQRAARHITGADLAVSVTGVAGPDPDERGVPVGIVYIGLATPEGTFCRKMDSGRRPAGPHPGSGRQSRLRPDPPVSHGIAPVSRFGKAPEKDPGSAGMGRVLPEAPHTGPIHDQSKGVHRNVG